MERNELLQKSFASINIELTDEQTQQFLLYADLLCEWNEKINLTTITDFPEVVIKHFVDSLMISQSSNVSRETLANGKIIDVGTGAGFPGIPLKIIYPNAKITLLDSLNKRVTFLNQVILELHLKKITAIHGRAEEVGRNPEHREHYELCVSRAVANLSTLSEYCLPLVRRGGYFVAYKSGNIKEEVAAADKAVNVMGGKFTEIEMFQLPNTDIQRSLVPIRKTSPTPKKYPRKAGTPAKQPL